MLLCSAVQMSRALDQFGPFTLRPYSIPTQVTLSNVLLVKYLGLKC